jgi:ABC-type microcin C transport system duplicated ATPase subunit YejF
VAAERRQTLPGGGSGKSVTALSIMRLLPRLTAKIPQGRIVFDGRSLLDLSTKRNRRLTHAFRQGLLVYGVCQPL